MQVSDIDLRLLRVFRAVVDCGGFSNAQSALNSSQSTISTQMSQLEARLGIKLCQRGRSGFKLTAEGEVCYRNTVDLFKSIYAFQAQSDELRGVVSGVLRVAFLDNIVTDPNAPLCRALQTFVKDSGQHVRLVLEVLSPQDMERRLLDSSLDVAIGIFCSQLPSLTYRPLYRERDSLVCAPDHPLAKIKAVDALHQAVPNARKVIRSFLGTLEFAHLDSEESGVHAAVTNVEAAAHLILTGKFIGFLPQHYSKLWIDRGNMVELLPNYYVHYSDFSMVIRASGRQQSALSAFMESMNTVCGGQLEAAARLFA